MLAETFLAFVYFIATETLIDVIIRSQTKSEFSAILRAWYFITRIISYDKT